MLCSIRIRYEITHVFNACFIRHERGNSSSVAPLAETTISRVLRRTINWRSTIGVTLSLRNDRSSSCHKRLTFFLNDEVNHRPHELTDVFSHRSIQSSSLMAYQPAFFSENFLRIEPYHEFNRIGDIL